MPASLRLLRPFENRERLRSGALLGLLLRAADGATILASGQRDRHRKALVVVGPLLPDHAVLRRRLQQRLRALLQPRLVVVAGPLIGVLERLAEQPLGH